MDKNLRRSVDLEYSEPFTFELAYVVNEHLPSCQIGFLLHATDGTPVFEIYDIDDDTNAGYREPGSYLIRCEVPGKLLNQGRYSLSLNAGVPGVKNLAYVEGALQFTVHDHSSASASMNLPA